MKLDDALRVLAREFTSYDPKRGFAVKTSTMLIMPHEREEYVAAWEAVRKRIGAPTKPLHNAGEGNG